MRLATFSIMSLLVRLLLKPGVWATFFGLVGAAVAATNDVVVIPARDVVTNNYTILMVDRSLLPAAPTEVRSVTVDQEAVIVTNFFGLGWDAVWPDAYNELLESPEFVGPPDTPGAVGTSHVLTMLNTEVRVQNRDGTDTGGFRTSLRLWWTNSITGPFQRVFDPRVLYDPYNHRWIATAFLDQVTTNSALVIAVSRTSDPTTVGTNGWNFIRVKADTNSTPTVWLDQPFVGFNKDWIVVHGNMRLFDQPLTMTIP